MICANASLGARQTPQKEATASPTEVEKNRGFSFTMDFATECVFRGAVLTDEEDLQPSVEFSFSEPFPDGDVTVGVWGNRETSNITGESGNFTEMDYYVDCTKEVCDGASASWEDVWKPCEGVHVGVEAGLTLGYGSDAHNEFIYGADDDGFSDLSLSLSLPFSIGDNVTVSPGISGRFLLDDDIHDAASEPDGVMGTLSISFGF